MSPEPFTVLVVGGYGVFGSRICRLLAREHRISLMIAGRSLGRAEALRDDLRGDPGTSASIGACLLDIAGNLSERLRALGPDLVIHTAGPFQDQDYGVARCCIDLGIHYIDLSDGRDFVTGIGTLDGAAKAANVLVVAGASSVPALSGAVLDRICADFHEVETIEIAVSPGNRTPRGPGLIAAILGYVGQPIPLWQDGRETQVFGWQGLRRRTLSIEGLAPVGPRWLSYCDVPDLALFKSRYGGVRGVAFRAGLELGFLHLGLWLLSWPVRWHLLPKLSFFAPLARTMAAWVETWGSDRGGMVVSVTGRDDEARSQRRVWILIAQGGHGPFVPCLPAVALARALRDGRIERRGASPCLGFLSLEELLAPAAGLDLHWRESNR